MEKLQTAAQLQAALELQSTERVLALGIPAIDDVLPRRGLVLGSVVELQVQGASGAATSLALCACRAAQRAAPGWQRGLEASRPWCAFIDPTASLFAPAVARLGVDLERLLVIRPRVDALERVAVRAAEARAFALLVIDLRGALQTLPVSKERWPRTIRRLALAIKSVATSVLVLTSAEPRATLPLPVALRLELARASSQRILIRVGKERSGHVSRAREVPVSAFEEAWRVPAERVPANGYLADIEGRQ